MPPPVVIDMAPVSSGAYGMQAQPRGQPVDVAVAAVGPPRSPLTFVAFTVGVQLRVQWCREVMLRQQLLDPTRYTVTGGNVVVTGVEYFGTYVILTYTGTFEVGGTYVLEIADGTAVAKSDGLPNGGASSIFVGTLDVLQTPPALTFVAYMLGAQLRVHWGRPVEDTSTVRTPSRYTVSGPTTVEVTVVAYAPTYLVLTLSGDMRPGQTYTLSVAAETAQALGDGQLNDSGGSSFLGVDMRPPEVAYKPGPGTPVDPTEAVQVDVYDASGLRTVLVTVDFPDLGLSEVVHDGGASFKKAYWLSTRTSPGPGLLRYSVRRVGGWPAAPEFNVYVTDVAGNEV